jgi:hypothetical protein
MAPLERPLRVAAPLWGECWVGCCPAVASLVEASLAVAFPAAASLVGAFPAAASQAGACPVAASQAAVAPAGLARAGAVAIRAPVGPLEGQEST